MGLVGSLEACLGFWGLGVFRNPHVDIILAMGTLRFSGLVKLAMMVTGIINPNRLDYLVALIVAVRGFALAIDLD